MSILYWWYECLLGKGGQSWGPHPTLRGLQPVNSDPLFWALCNNRALHPLSCGCSRWFCTGFIWLLNGWFPHDFFCSHFISNLPGQRNFGQIKMLEGGYIIDFTGFRMAMLSLHQSPVYFTLQTWLFLNILLGFYNRKSICYNWRSYSAKS